MAGDANARDYLVTGCQDLEHSVQPGGSTIHVEHARGLRNVIITNNRCRKSILAGGVDGMLISGNLITGRLVGNNNTNLVVKDNIIRGVDSPSAVIQLGYTNGLILKDNVITGQNEKASGIYVWGKSRYNPAPSSQVQDQRKPDSGSGEGYIPERRHPGQSPGQYHSVRR